MKLFKRFAVILTIFFFFPGEEIVSGGEDNRLKGTLVVYLYQPVANPQDISFTLDKVEIKRRNGEWISLAIKPTSLRSIDMQGNQILLAELRLMEGKYRAIRMWVSNASFMRNKKNFNLALPQPDKNVEIEVGITIREGESSALFLKWDPNKSIKGDYLFQPLIRPELQKLSPQSVLLYVTNSGSNYISVVDRFENRVVATIGVEQAPTGLVLSQEQERLYVLNSRSSSVSIIDTTQDFVRERIQLISGIEPLEMAMIPDNNNRNNGKLYITNKGSNDVTVVDTDLKSQITTVKVGNEPLGIAANSKRQEVYVANSGSNSISVIDSRTDTVKVTINVDSKPLDFVIVDDLLYVLNGRANRITVIDIASKKVTNTISPGANPRKAIYSEQFDRVYLTNYDTSQISFLIPSLGVVTRSINLGVQPIGLAIDENRNRLYVTGYNSNVIAVVNPVSEMVEKIITVGKKPYGIVFIK